jgi:hypothetical protein
MWLLSKISMSEASSRPVVRRLLYGGLALAALALVVVVGYSVLWPASLPAKTPTRPPLWVASVQSDTTAQPDQPAAPARADQPNATPSPDPAPLIPPTPLPAAEPSAPPTPTWGGTVTGRVVDAKREPLAGASIVAAGRELRTGPDGAFTAELSGTSPILVKFPGFEKVLVPPTPGPLEIVLKSQVIKGAYLTYYGFNDRGIRGRVLDLVGRTELNAVVIDVKGDRGWILYRTEVPLALAASAQGPATIKDFDPMMADLKARGVYTIARIVTFKDNVLATHRPDLAILDTRTGRPWIDRENLAWVDPFHEEVWDYNIAIAREAVRKGFDEVQFDYVRFPTDGKLGAARYSKPNTKDTRLPAVAAFLARARREIGPLGAFVGADIFGYTAFNENDTDIGQRIEELAPHVDFLCPMVYPSGYHLGIPGYRNPVAHPYEVVHESVRLIRKRASGAPIQVRPWLQDFRDYAFDRRIFGVPEIRAQIKAAADGGGAGWMLWNPRNDYTGAALKQKGALVSR